MSKADFRTVMQTKYLIAKRLPMVMGSLMLQHLDVTPDPFCTGGLQVRITYYSILTEKEYGYQNVTQAALLKETKGITSYMDHIFGCILRELSLKELEDQEFNVLKDFEQRRKDEIRSRGGF